MQKPADNANTDDSFVVIGENDDQINEPSKKEKTRVSDWLNKMG